MATRAVWLGPWYAEHNPNMSIGELYALCQQRRKREKDALELLDQCGELWARQYAPDGEDSRMIEARLAALDALPADLSGIRAMLSDTDGMTDAELRSKLASIIVARTPTVRVETQTD